MDPHPATTGGIWADETDLTPLTPAPTKPTSAPTLLPQTHEKRLEHQLSEASSQVSDNIPSLAEIVEGVTKKLAKDLGYPGGTFKTAMATREATIEKRVHEWVDRQFESKSEADTTVPIVDELRNQIDILSNKLDEVIAEASTRADSENKIFEQAMEVINRHPELVAEVRDTATSTKVIDEMRAAVEKNKTLITPAPQAPARRIRKPGRIV